jgi:cytidylate kinase
MLIAIDGPAGSGKSTVAKMLATKIAFFYLDTGATYRALGLAVVRKTGKKEDFSPQEILKVLEEVELRAEYINGDFRIYIDGEDVSEEIRTEEAGRYASLVARFPEVKERLFEFQRRLVNRGNAVVEGRDAGLYVFPNADVKIFLTASPEVRAKRRLQQLRQKGITDVTYEEILKAITERDKRDQTRKEYPFKPAPDAVIIDTSDKTLEEVFQEVWRLVEPYLNLFITGVGSGLGLALAKEFINRGYTVFALSRREPAELKGNPRFVFAHCDLSNLEEVRDRARLLLERVNRQLPWAVLNAGILGELKEMRQTPLREFRKVLDVNLWSNKILLDLLWDLQNEGRLKVGQVVAISSGAAVNCNKGWNAYSLSKAALNCAIKLYHWEFEDSHLLSLAPGLITTPMLEKVLQTADEDRFPSVKRIRQSPKHTPESAAKMLLGVFPSLVKFPSGSFIDVRKEFPQIYNAYLP